MKLLFVFVAAFAVVGTASPCQFAPGLQDYYTVHNGLKRRTLLYVPQSLGEDPSLVLALHGIGSSPEDLSTNLRWNEIAESQKIVVAYPAGELTLWNAGWILPDILDVDDVGFLRQLVAELQGKGCGHPNRTFATGFSMGSIMDYRLACEASDVFAAIAPCSGIQADWLREFDPIVAYKCEPKQKVAVMHWHGTKDLKITLQGSIFFLVHAHPVNTTLAAWSERNGCDWSQQATTFVTENITCTGPVCHGGEDASNITFCLVEGMGHHVSRGSEFHIWDFFKAYPRR